MTQRSSRDMRTALGVDNTGEKGAGDDGDAEEGGDGAEEVKGGDGGDGGEGGEDSGNCDSRGSDIGDAIEEDAP